MEFHPGETFKDRMQNTGTIICILLAMTISAAGTFAAERTAVSVVFSSDISAYHRTWDEIRKRIEYRGVFLQVSDFNLERESPEEIFSRISQQRPACIVSFGTRASLEARERITDTPVIFCMVFDTQKIISPHVTGVSMNIPEEIQIREIQRILPGVKKIGLVYSAQTIQRLQELSAACQRFGIQLIAKQIDLENELPDVIRDISWAIDCFLMIPDSKIYFQKSVEFLLLESLREKFPVVGLSSYYTKAGALFSLDCDYEDLGEQAADIIWRVLKGESPAQIQPTMPRKIILSVNLITAKRLGILLPCDVIEEAQEVYGQ